MPLVTVAVVSAASDAVSPARPAAPPAAAADAGSDGERGEAAPVAPARAVMVGDSVDIPVSLHSAAPAASAESAREPAVLVDVSFDLDVTLQLAPTASSRGVSTVASALAAPFRAAYAAAARLLSGGSLRAPRVALRQLRGVRGVLRAGRMTLVLANAGGGKSTLLRALAGLLRVPRGALARASHVSYGGLRGRAALAAGAGGAQLQQLADYMPQLDEHLALLTVRETLDFVAANALAGADAAARAARVADTLALLGLGAAADTLVGGGAVRGVSGGERRRVTIGCGLITRAQLLACDEITTGLDSALAHAVVAALRARAQSLQATVVAALLQPTPEIYALFDDVLLLRDGALLYHGTREALPGYLARLGFAPPAAAGAGAGAGAGAAARMDMADWLAALLTAPAATHAAGGGGGSSGKGGGPPPPLTTDGLAAAWAAEAASLPAPAPPAALLLAGPAARAQFGVAHVHSGGAHLLATLRRQLLLMSRNKVFLAMRVFTSLIMGVILGGMFYDQPTSAGLQRYGLFLNVILVVAFANITEMGTACANKYVAYAQVDAGLFPPAAYVGAAVVAHLPLAAIESLAFSALIYWMTGLAPDVGRFFFFALCVFLIDLFAGNLFRIFAYAFPNLAMAQAVPMPIISALTAFAGMILAPSQMGGWVFLYWLDVYGWLLRSMALNEFYSPGYASVPPGSSVSVGVSFLEVIGMETNIAYQWSGIAFAVVAIAIVIASGVAAFTLLRFDHNFGSARMLEEEVPPAAADAAAPAKVAVPVAPPPPPPPHAARAALPFTPTTLVFVDLAYAVPQPGGGGSRQLLQGLTGYAQPGRILGLMGASGAGKTTLLDVLAGRKAGRVSGTVRFNGAPASHAAIALATAYVQQTASHDPLSTVGEALAFSAALRQPASVPAAARAAVVAEALALLELRAIKDAVVGAGGASGSGLSPGELKRLTIGVELVANAPVLFLDEPTSGLDARAAATVMAAIRAIADSGRTVICTVHAPTAAIFRDMDDLLLLQKGGWQVFFGPLGADAANLKAALAAAAPAAQPCPAAMNPASWMLDVLRGSDSSAAGGAAGTAKAGGAAPVEAAPTALAKVPPPTPAAEAGGFLDGPTLQAVFRASPAWAAVLARLRELSEQPAKSAVAAAALEPAVPPAAGSDASSAVAKGDASRATAAHVTRAPATRARSFCAQYYIVTSALFRSYWRDAGYNLGRLGSLFVISLLFGVIYFKILTKATDISGLTSSVAAIFMTAAFCAILQMGAALPMLITARAVVYREVASGMYSPLVRALGLVTVEIPWLFLILFFVFPVSYLMLGEIGSLYESAPPGMVAAEVYFFSYLVVVILAFSFISLGQLLAAAAPSYDLAQAGMGVIMPIMMLFGGLFQPRTHMPAGTQWINTIDPIAYAYNAIVSPQFYCDASKGACPTISVPTEQGLVTVDRWAFIVALYGMDYSTRWTEVGVLILFVVIFQAGHLACAQFLHHGER